MNVRVVDMSGNPTVISTFAGTGGSSLGYHLAGFKEILAIDFDAHAVECFKENFSDVPVWHRSVTEVTSEEIMSFCKINKGELDVFDGSPPCQGFSISGKREVKDKRNNLFLDYWRLIDGLQPKVFVMENVSGMVKGVMKGRFVEIIKTLKSGNYLVKCKKMNSKFYGVPQSRERLFFIGVRKDLNKEPVFPAPSNKIISAGEALKNIKPSEILELTDKYGKMWSKVPVGGNCSDVVGTGFNSCIKINPLKPSPTVNKTTTGKGFGTMVHWSEPRAIAINEAKILCSFPENFKLIGSYPEQWARLGNAVMPKMMQAIAETIKNQILCK